MQHHETLRCSVVICHEQLTLSALSRSAKCLKKNRKSPHHVRLHHTGAPAVVVLVFFYFMSTFWRVFKISVKLVHHPFISLTRYSETSAYLSTHVPAAPRRLCVGVSLHTVENSGVLGYDAVLSGPRRFRRIGVPLYSGAILQYPI